MYLSRPHWMSMSILVTQGCHLDGRGIPTSRTKVNQSDAPVKEYDGETDSEFITVSCGTARGRLYLTRAQHKAGNKLPKCILASDKWFTPSEFEGLGGKAKCSKWRNSIRHSNQPLSSFLPSGSISDLLSLVPNGNTPTNRKDLSVCNASPSPGRHSAGSSATDVVHSQSDLVLEIPQLMKQVEQKLHGSISSALSEAIYS